MPKIIFILISITLILCSCSHPGEERYASLTDESKICDEKSYIDIDDIIFLGESTTYHLKSRGVLSGGTETKQVWAPRSGTLMLDSATSECRIIYPETNEELPLIAALQKKRPKYIMLTFGLNGATNFIKRGSDYFKYCYQKLSDEIKRASRDTKIIINSCFPIAADMNMQKYKIDAKTLNAYIDQINIWAKDFAQENGFIYVNTSDTLKNSNGFLDSELQMSDGYHLNTKAYQKILEILRNTEINGE